MSLIQTYFCSVAECGEPKGMCATFCPLHHARLINPRWALMCLQYNPCPFCNKVKAYLDYSRLPWSAVEVDPLFKKEMKHTGFKKVKRTTDT